MSKPNIQIHNSETGEIDIRPMNDEEYTIYLAEIEVNKKTKEEIILAKTAAEAKLAALGLTADDLKALGLGGN